MPQMIAESNFNRVFLGFGANLGNPLAQFHQARAQLAKHQQIKVISSSPIYQAPAIGGPENQPDFLNAVIEIHVTMSAHNLLHFCHQLENFAGRTRKVHWGPRLLDIDLLFFSDQLIQTPELKVPHPRLHQRHFVLLPLSNLDPNLDHPLLKCSVAELLEQLPSTDGITQIIDSW